MMKRCWGSLTSGFRICPQSTSLNNSQACGAHSLRFTDQSAVKLENVLLVGKRERLPSYRPKHSTPGEAIEFFLFSLNCWDSRITDLIKRNLQNERDVA